MKRALLALLLTLASSVATASPAAAGFDSPDYLALGDSVPFGFDPTVQDRSDPDNFVGYPELLAGLLAAHHVNPSCPGEASGGFISLTGTDNACRPYRANFPLHVDYDSSQLDFAVDFLDNHPDVRLVTITIGANDVFILQRRCREANPGSPQGEAACVNGGLPGVLATIQANLGSILDELEDAAGPHVHFVVVTYYALAYDPATTAQTMALNSPLIAAAREHDAIVASGFDAFKPAALAAGGSSCAAGLLVRLPSGGCDIHPSRLGHTLLALAVARALAAAPVPEGAG